MSEYGRGAFGLLDICSATESAVAGIRRIGNVGMVLFSRETAGLVGRLNAGNVGAYLEAPADARIISGTSEEMVICPASLRSVIARKCDVLRTRLVLYEGTLWVAEDEEEVLPSRFDFMEGKTTLLVLGEMRFDPAVDPKILADRLVKIHNLGEIYCTGEQRGAIQARLGISEGELLDSEQIPEVQEGIGNIGHLAL